MKMFAPITRDAHSFLGEGMRDPAAERLPDGARHASAVCELKAAGLIGWTEPTRPGGSSYLTVTPKGVAYYGEVRR